MLRAYVAAVAIVVAGCAHPQEYPGLSYGPECDAPRARALADSSAPGLRQPAALTLRLPPAPFPSSVANKTALATMSVDVYGNTMKGTARVTGLDDLHYTKLLASVIEDQTYTPASLDGCAVPGIAHWTYQFGPARPPS